jgi:CubicO group peptidase (beta-lactamase class C family)
MTDKIKSLGFLIGLIGCATAAAQAATLSAGLSAAAKTIVGPKTVPSLSVAIVTHGKITQQASFGQATSRTAYWIGSATKTLTATSIMQLVQQKQLSLDDSLAKYYPAQTQWADVTIRDLLDHTSGIPNYLDDAVARRLVLKLTTPQEIVTNAAAQPLRFKPGSDWSYSNTNYVLLGQIVEKISGMSLAQYEQQHIFNVAGMTHTAVGKAPGGATLAPPFVAGAAAKILGSTPGDPSWYYACGDVISTAADMARFDIALMSGKLVSAETFALMQQMLPNETLTGDMRDGLGLFATTYGNMTLIGHHGGVAGYMTDNEMVPSDSFAVVIMGNGEYNTDTMLDVAMAQQYPDTARTVALERAKVPPDLSDSRTQQLILIANDLLQGKIDRSLFTGTVNAAITPAMLSALPVQFAPFGTLEGLKLEKKLYTHAIAVYRFGATFTHKKATLVVAFQSDGKIAALNFLP